MKPRAANPFRSHLATLAALLAAPLAHAGSGTWLGTSGDWGVAGTWSGGTIADGIDSTANFTGVNITADQIINLEAARTIGNITFTDTTTASHNLTISGACILTLDRTAGAPIIDVTQTGRTLTISSQISGADGMQKNGTGTLSLSGPNDYTVISNGILAISSNTGQGSSAAGSNQTTIAATGASTGPQWALSDNINSGENITLTGNTEQNQYNAAIINSSGTNTLNYAYEGNQIALVQSGGNLAPGISDIADLSVPSGCNTGSLAFTITDEDVNSVTPSGSSNLTLVPNGNIVVSGSGASRTVTPVSGLRPERHRDHHRLRELLTVRIRRGIP